MTVTRRLTLAAAFAASVAVSAAPAAYAAEKIAEVTKVFPYLEAFLKVPAAQRTRVRVAYGFSRDGKPAAGLQGWYVAPNGERTPVPISSAGVVERLPTLDQLKNGTKIAFNVDSSVKMGTRIEIMPSLRPAQEMDARELAATLTEANAVIGKAAGPMALMAPKMARLSFHGAGSGVVVLADGQSVPMEVIKGSPVYDPAATPKAMRVKLAKTPTRAVFLQKK